MTHCYWCHTYDMETAMYEIEPSLFLCRGCQHCYLHGIPILPLDEQQMEAEFNAWAPRVKV